MDHIIANIYLGNISDAISSRGEMMSRLYVHEDIVPDYTPTYHIPILNLPPEVRELDNNHFSPSKNSEKIRLVSHEKLEEAFLILDQYRESQKPLLIHCLGGIERSPLTLALWLIRIGQMPDLDEAYAHLMKIRPIVEDRRHWIP